MSLSRALFNEFRPLFRMLEDPFAADPAFSAFMQRQRSYDPFNWQSSTPALNLSEENDHYIVEAEVPGVRKENLGLRVGDGGRSLTIEGKVFPSRRNDATAASQGESPSTPADASKSTAMTKTQGKHPHLALPCRRAATDSPVSDDNQEVSNYTGGSLDGTRTFTRTVWLPHRINASAVNAKLDHGVLTVTAAKAKDESISINVE
jgi:HSP20 family molecular chaperone IbpA